MYISQLKNSTCRFNKKVLITAIFFIISSACVDIGMIDYNDISTQGKPTENMSLPHAYCIALPDVNIQLP